MNPTEIKNTILKLPTNKAPGDDKITNKVLKQLSNKSRAFLATLYNAVIRLSYFPSSWKFSVIHAVHKPGKNPITPSSYRPIGLLSVVGKLFEKLLLKRILLEYPNLMPDHQFGFRNRHSAVE